MRISYWICSRRNGALCTIDFYREKHPFLGKFIPEYILYNFFRWYSSSKIGKYRAKNKDSPTITSGGIHYPN
jgi:hypothetical protein